MLKPVHGESPPPDQSLTLEERERHVVGRTLRVAWEGGNAAFPLPTRGRLIVGRAADAHIYVPHPSVSRQHCQLHVAEGIEVEDLGSRNGTAIAGRRIEARQRVPLPAGVALSAASTLLVVDGSNPAWEQSEHRAVYAEESPFARSVELAGKFASSDLPVLITGETGTGKDVIAQLVQQHSLRVNAPYVRVNCAALPLSLAEAELFGHEKGAFTGAEHTKPGLLEAAHGGTVFLDEVAELPLEFQVKLLRAVENKEILRVGARKPKRIDVRFISATNRDIKALVAEGRFREDLYFRLAGVELALPPLRERPGDIVLLANHFLSASGRHNKLTADTIAALGRHPFPGNARELKNVVERAAILAGERPIDMEHLVLDASGFTSAPTSAPTSADVDGSLHAVVGSAEATRIRQALSECGNNQTQAAKQLGISRSTLLRRLARYGIR